MEKNKSQTGGMFMLRTHAAIAAAAAAIAVALGAFGAHVLEGRLTADLLASYETGVRYHMYHALGALAISLAAGNLPGRRWAVRAVNCLFAGIVLFSGSLYVLAITGFTALGAITPVGGVLFIAGWACLAAAVFRSGG